MDLHTGQGVAKILVPHWVAANPCQLPRNLGQPAVWSSMVKKADCNRVPRGRCLVQPKVIEIGEQVCRALQGGMDFAQRVLEESDEYITGDVGVKRDTAHRWSLFGQCYAVRDLARKPVTELQVRAFRELYSLAWEELRWSYRPPQDWGTPATVPKEPPVEMYRTFAARISAAWVDEVQQMVSAGRSSRGWVANGGVVVTPWAWRLLAIGAANRDWSCVPLRAAQITMQFISCFTVCAAKITKPRGVKFLSRVRREINSSFSFSDFDPWWRAGNFIAMVNPFLKKRCIAMVVRPVWEPKDEAIARSLEADRTFSDHVWAVARHFHRERRRGVSTAAAEGWTGILSRLWNSVQGQSSGSMVDRLQLAACGFKGIGEDEHIVTIVENAVRGSPFVAKFHGKLGAKAARAAALAAKSRRLGLGRANKPWSQTQRASDLSQKVQLARMSLFKWQKTAATTRASYDRADLSQRDVDRLLLHRGKRKIALEEFPFTRVQRARYSKLCASARHAFRVRMRELQQEMRPEGQQHQHRKDGKSGGKGKGGKSGGKGRGRGRGKGTATSALALKAAARWAVSRGRGQGARELSRGRGQGAGESAKRKPSMPQIISVDSD